MSGAHQTALLRALPADACLTLDDLEPLAGLPRKALKQALGKLIARTLVERVERGCYQLTPAGREAQASGVELTSAPRSHHPSQFKLKNTLRSRIWAAARMRPAGFTAGDLAQLAGQGEADPEGEARRYLRALLDAGYLRKLRRSCRDPGAAQPGAGAIRYSLIRNTGPHAPIVSRRGGQLRDPNTGEVVSCRP